MSMAATVLQFRMATNEEASSCCNCGVEFASPVLVKRRADGEWFFCPNGHKQHFSETDATRLQKQLDDERRRRMSAESEAEWAKDEARTARTQETKAKNKLKRVETRINAGVCPHCNRTFQQLARHMACKHGNSDTTQTSHKVKS